MLAEFPKAGLAVTGFGGEELKFASRVKGRARASFELGFVVVSVDVAQASRAKDLDNSLGSRREMSSSDGSGRRREHGGQGQPSETSCGFLQKITP